MPAEVEEEKIREKTPSATVKKIALLKAQKVRRQYQKEKELLIISADTMVYCQKKYIGKPKSLTDAKQILLTLSNTTHWLYSGICVLHQSFSHSGGVKVKTYLDFDKTKVTFRKLDNKEIEEYIANNPVCLWAGAYTIEKGTPGESFIKKIQGSGSNVLGLPMKKLKRILNYPLSSSLYK